ncbi:hypothetical protein [Bacteroides acidifaciens]|uniref:hypothetical protein n=1 Tax=Bacteroides acidifaciens TaxID=85831 RepID=UPI0025ADA23B|nr:hypothetical protein [Bacteroides acidifaciens]
MKVIATTITERENKLKLITSKDSAKNHINETFTIMDIMVYEKNDSRITGIIGQDENGKEIVLSSNSNSIADTAELLIDIFERDNPIKITIRKQQSGNKREYLYLEV